MICSDRTFKECMDKRLFASKDERDIADIGEDTAVFLWNCFQRELHGVWVTTKQGNLDPHAFGGRYQCQVAANICVHVQLHRAVHQIVQYC